MCTVSKDTAFSSNVVFKILARSYWMLLLSLKEEMEGSSAGS